MAIAVDSTAGNTGTTSPNIWSHICTGSNLILFVAVRAEGVSATVSVTYNGVSMTQAGSKSSSGSEVNFLFYLLNPATGTHNVSVTFSGSYGNGASASYTGVKQSGFPDASANSGGGIVTPPLNVSVTTVADNCWVIASGQDNTGSGVVGAGTSTTARKFQNNSLIILDTNGVVSPAGSRTLQLTDTAGSAGLSLVAVSFEPSMVVGPFPTHFNS